MSSIFVIERGEYSDYRVEGVFSTRENAEKALAVLNQGQEFPDGTVAEWPLDPGIKEMAKGMRVWNVTMDIDGVVENIYATTGEMMPRGMSVWHRTTAPRWRGESITDAVHGEVWAKDEKHAIKIFNEYRLEAIAQGQMHRT